MQHDKNNHSAESTDKNSDDLSRDAAEAIADILSEIGVEAQSQETVAIANEILEKFTMMQRAAGATSQVSITKDPRGGVESARSVKLRNLVYNVKNAALALPVPALLNVLARNNTPASVRMVMGAITAVFAGLSILANALNIRITQQAAAILQLMWVIAGADAEIVRHEGLLDRVNLEFEKFGWRQIDMEELVSYLEALEKIGCIERTSNSILVEQLNWRLREELKVSFARA